MDEISVSLLVVSLKKELQTSGRCRNLSKFYEGMRQAKTEQIGDTQLNLEQRGCGAGWTVRCDSHADSDDSSRCRRRHSLARGGTRSQSPRPVLARRPPSVPRAPETPRPLGTGRSMGLGSTTRRRTARDRRPPGLTVLELTSGHRRRRPARSRRHCPYAERPR